MSSIVLFNNIRKLIFLRERLCFFANEAPKIKIHIQKGFIRWIFNLNVLGLFQDFKIKDLNVFESIVKKDLTYANTYKKEDFEFNFDIKYEYMLFNCEHNVNKLNIKKTESKTHIYLTLYLFENQTIVVKLHKKQFERLRKLHIEKNHFLEHCFILGYFYTHVDCVNMHLSFHPNFLKEHHVDHELFGTPLNTTLNNYCSPLDFELKYFKSQGSFFHFNDFQCDCVYTANGPFDEIILKEMVIKLLKVLQTKKNVTILITLPVWDLKTKSELGLVLSQENQQEFEAFTILTEQGSSFIKTQQVFKANEFLYYDYYNDRHKGITPIHFFVLHSD